ncbi:zinc finger protein 568-like [Culicoides brevitarsis]|uniref:zinc finger protein 568-like n=1 Tax=Culicoides brevitarsis TaxID=469753 RepID=UPI00307C580D
MEMKVLKHEQAMSDQEESYEAHIQCEICGNFFELSGNQRSREKCPKCGHLQDIEDRTFVYEQNDDEGLCEVCGLNFDNISQHEKIHQECSQCGYIPLTKEEKVKHSKLCGKLQIHKVPKSEVKIETDKETLEEMYLIEVLTEPIMEDVIIQIDSENAENESCIQQVEVPQKPTSLKYKYKCKSCTYISTKQNVIRHGKVCLKRTIAHTCTKCEPNKVFSTMKALKQHLKDVHEGKSHICKICSKGFARGSNLKRHEKCHERRT